MAHEPTSQREASPGRRRLRILHLEDDAEDAELVEAQLQRHGIACRVTRVATRAAFQAALDQAAVDLILSDSNLPSFDGASALKMAAAKCPGTPFIFVSGDTSDAAAREALAWGADDYVPKGDLSRLIAIVQRAFGEPDSEK
ncbi:MAG: response regulator [Verrucomicrobia bacterium]|nr:response regulator [Verrucomicrobiota bacterium]